jgi:hypothetical protein
MVDSASIPNLTRREGSAFEWMLAAKAASTTASV